VITFFINELTVFQWRKRNLLIVRGDLEIEIRNFLKRGKIYGGGKSSNRKGTKIT